MAALQPAHLPAILGVLAAFQWLVWRWRFSRWTMRISTRRRNVRKRLRLTPLMNFTKAFLSASTFCIEFSFHIFESAFDILRSWQVKFAFGAEASWNSDENNWQVPVGFRFQTARVPQPRWHWGWDTWLSQTLVKHTSRRLKRRPKTLLMLGDGCTRETKAGKK